MIFLPLRPRRIIFAEDAWNETVSVPRTHNQSRRIVNLSFLQISRLDESYGKNQYWRLSRYYGKPIVIYDQCSQYTINVVNTQSTITGGNTVSIEVLGFTDRWTGTQRHALVVETRLLRLTRAQNGPPKRSRSLRSKAANALWGAQTGTNRYGGR